MFFIQYLQKFKNYLKFDICNNYVVYKTHELGDIYFFHREFYFYKDEYFRQFCIDNKRKHMEIHHINLNKRNNKLNNLVPLPKKTHIEYHKLLKISKIKADDYIRNIYLHNKELDNYNEYLKISEKEAQEYMWYVVSIKYYI